MQLLISLSETENVNVVTNLFPRTFPMGSSIEVIESSALERAVDATNDPDERAHMTRYFCREPDRFRIRNIKARDSGFGDVSLAVDTGLILSARGGP